MSELLVVLFSTYLLGVLSGAVAVAACLKWRKSPTKLVPMQRLTDLHERVFVTRSGACYHARADCSGLNLRTNSVEERRPCRVCHKVG